MQIALKVGAETELFTFSRTYTFPRTALKHSSAPLALLDLNYLFSDCDLAAEDFLPGLPVLQHLDVDTSTLLEERQDVLDASDCVSISTSFEKPWPCKLPHNCLIKHCGFQIRKKGQCDSL